MDLSGASKARPFVSPMAWALYSAYEAITLQAVIKFHMIKSGVFVKELIDKDVAAKLVKAVLPHRTEAIDKLGEIAYYHLLEELDERLLGEFRKMLAGVEADKASIDQAAEILRASKEVREAGDQSALLSKGGL